MAETLELIERNRVRVKYLVHQKKYFLFIGNTRILIDGDYQTGFQTLETATSVAKGLSMSSYPKYFITTKTK